MFVSIRRNAVAIAVGVATVALLAGQPVMAHISTPKHAWTKHFQPLADARYELKGTPASWATIQGVPSGFADGVDNTVASWSDIQDIPAGFADGVDDTGGTASDVDCTGCVDEGDMAFDPATQGELNGHKTSGDHDSRYARRLWAKVFANGTLQVGQGVSSTSRQGTGFYYVNFSQSINDCAAVATTGALRTGPSSDTGFYPGGTVAQTRTWDNSVTVLIYNHSGTAVDDQFHLIVVC